MVNRDPVEKFRVEDEHVRSAKHRIEMAVTANDSLSKKMKLRILRGIIYYIREMIDHVKGS